jgi:hypothetical protein
MNLLEFIEFTSRLKNAMIIAIRKNLENQFGLSNETANELINIMKTKENVETINLFLRMLWNSGECDRYGLEEIFLKNITEDDFGVLSKYVENLKEAHEM